MADESVVESITGDQSAGGQETAQDSQQNVEGAAEQRSETAERAAPAAGEPKELSFSEFLANSGLDAGDRPVDQVATDIVAGLRDRQRLEQVNEQNQRILNQLMAERQARQEAEQKVDETAEKPWYTGKYDPIKRDPIWESWIETDESGKKGFAQNTPDSVISAYREAALAEESRLQQLARNPAEFFSPLLENVEQRAKRIAEEAIQQHLAKREEDARIEDIVSTYGKHMFEAGADGRPDPNRPNQLGQMILAEAQRFEQMGVKNVSDQFALAQERVLSHLKQQAPEPTPEDKEQQEQQVEQSSAALKTEALQRQIDKAKRKPAARGEEVLASVTGNVTGKPLNGRNAVLNRIRESFEAERS